MRLEESSIYIGLKKLRRWTFRVQKWMTKADRIIYGVSLREESGQALSNYVMAFLSTNPQKKVEYLEESMKRFTCLRLDFETCIEENIIHFRKRKLDEGIPQATDQTPQNGDAPVPTAERDPRDEVSTKAVELFALVARVDKDMCKWWASVSKGKTLYE